MLVARVIGWLALLAAVPGVLVFLVAQSLGIIEVLLPGLVWTLIVASLVGLFTVLVAVRRAWVVAVAVAVARVPGWNAAPLAAAAKGAVRMTAFRTAPKACCRST